MPEGSTERTELRCEACGDKISEDGTERQAKFFRINREKVKHYCTDCYKILEGCLIDLSLAETTLRIMEGKLADARETETVMRGCYTRSVE